MALAIVVTLSAAGVVAQPIDDLEFVNAPIRDIFAAIGSATGRTVIPDETVRGSASFYFTNTSFESAIDHLASQFGLFVTASDSVVSISSIRIVVDNDGLLDVDAPDTDIGQLVRRLSRETRQPVLFDRLPAANLTYHARRVSLEDALKHIESQLPDHELRTESGAFVFSRTEAPSSSAAPAGELISRQSGGLFSVSVAFGRFADIVSSLFETGDREYQMLKRSSPEILNLEFADKPFDELLSLVCERGDAQYSVVDGIYYILDAPPPAAQARAQQTTILRPNYLPLTSLVDALPAEQTAGVTLRPDRIGNSLSVTGTPQSVGRVVSLIRELDVRPPELGYHLITTRHIPVSALSALLPRHLSGLAITPLPDNQSFVVFASAEQVAELQDFMTLVDLPVEVTPVLLNHIQLETLMRNPPASAPPGSIISSGDPSRFFYRGSADGLTQFLEDLATIDQPLPQVRYQLLVIQYEAGTANEFAFDLSNSVSGADSAQVFLGNLGNLLSLNFNVIAAFGYQFAAQLEAQISNSTASVLVDTTLSALSGQSVRFQNTNTYRYRDTIAVGESQDDTPTGVVREITSGLILEIDGWVSGRDVVTMDVSATLSKRGVDSSDGNPPRTSEKVVDTHIRAASGEPVVLSGLIQHEDQVRTSGIPLLSRIPLVGMLFGNRDRTVEKTELAIYIIPRVERAAGDSESLDARLMFLFDGYGRSRR